MSVSKGSNCALATESFEIAELQRARAAHLKEAEKGKATPRKKSKSVVGVLKGIPLQILGSSAGVFLASMVTPAVISSRSVEALATYSLVFVMSNVLVSLFFALVPFERLYLRESTEVSLTDSEPTRGTLAGVARAAQHQISVKLCRQALEIQMNPSAEAVLERGKVHLSSKDGMKLEVISAYRVRAMLYEGLQELDKAASDRAYADKLECKISKRVQSFLSKWT